MDLTDEQWLAVEKHFPREERRPPGPQGGRPYRATRDVLNGVLWVLRTGAPWADLPSRYPPYQTCHRRFQGWVAGGTLPKVLAALRRDLEKRGGIEDVEGFIDGTYVPSKKGGPASGNAERAMRAMLMAVADRHGLPLAVLIDDGSRYDSVLTERTLDAAFVDQLPPRLIADRAWDGAPLRMRLAAERNIELIAPARTRTNRKPDGRKLRRYKRRWKIERLFAWLKRFRRIATRWEYKAENFLGIVHVACMVLLVRRLHPAV